jgi:gluconokinase
MTCIIGIDIGTSSTKVSAFARDGKLLATAQRSYPLLQPEPGHAEQDPELLLQAVLDGVDAVTSAVEGKAVISAMCFSAAMHGIMAIDQSGKPLTPIITWADTRSQAEANEIRESADGKMIYDHTGVPIHPMSPLCKLRWMGRHMPDIMSGAAIFAGIKEYVLYRLTGAWVMDHSIASATGLFDIRTLDWYAPALAWAGIRREQLPRAVASLESLVVSPRGRTLHPENAGSPAAHARDTVSRAHWAKNAKIIVGASDGCLANLGSGVMEPGLLSLTIGTSGAVRMTAPEPAVDPFGRIFNYVLWPGAYVTGGPVNNGGIILKWFSEQVLGRTFGGTDDVNGFLDEATSVPPGSEGLTCLPWFMGERAPIWDAGASGIFHGLTLRHTRAHLMRAIIEGISFSLCNIAGILAETAGPADRVRASGGFTASPQWVQMIADIFNKPVDIAQDTDASATGAAMLGFMSTGEATGWADFRSWTGSPKTFLPAPGQHERYQEAFQRFRNLAQTFTRT